MKGDLNMVKGKNKEKTKALVLFSGGLDSRLVIKILQDQKNPKLEVIALMFKLPFGGGCCNNEQCSFRFSQLQGTELKIIDCTKGKLLQEYLSLIKNPKFGRGTSLNPCIDCHLFMLKKAKPIAKKLKCQFIATGEVSGQRPMSQNKNALEIIEKEIGFKPLRPLIELGFYGRNRKPQIALAKKFNIKYPNPGGGCLLCEKEYCKKLRDLLECKQDNEISYEEILALKGFRHFRSKNKSKGKIILGKDQKENETLESLNKTLKWNILIPNTPCPTAIYEHSEDKKEVEKLIKDYSKKA